MMIEKNISIYVHYPWCKKKCPYCDFNSHLYSQYYSNFKSKLDKKKKEKNINDFFFHNLLEDLDEETKEIKGANLVSIYFGGGTPSLFESKFIGKTIDEIVNRFETKKNIEIYMEVNPEEITDEYINSLRNTKINRISIGAQTFNDQHLLFIGRNHNSIDIENAIKKIKNTFTNFNIDLMYGFRNQTLTQLSNDLEIIKKLNPPHISCYQLTVEEGTLFHKEKPKLPSNDQLEVMQTFIENTFKENYSNYEVSAFAKEKFECIHNFHYWTFGDYIGIGPGAHSKLTYGDYILRKSKVKDPIKYFDPLKRTLNVKKYAKKKILLQYLMNILRTNIGFDLNDIERVCNFVPTDLSKCLNKAKNYGLIEKNKFLKWVPTYKGRRFLNDLLLIFM